jgi:hypothetical protein
MVDAVGLHEIQTALGGSQPLLFHTVVVAQVSEHPATTALHPHTLVRGIDLTLSVQTGINAAVLGIHTMLQPERYAAVQLTSHPGLDFLQLIGIHTAQLL